MSWPPTVTEPSLMLAMPQMMLISVVLPAPLGPSRAKISPALMSRLTFFSALKPDSYVFDRLATEMMGDMLKSKMAAVVGAGGEGCRDIGTRRGFRNRPAKTAAYLFFAFFFAGVGAAFAAGCSLCSGSFAIVTI